MSEQVDQDSISDVALTLDKLADRFLTLADKLETNALTILDPTAEEDERQEQMGKPPEDLVTALVSSIQGSELNQRTKPKRQCIDTLNVEIVRLVRSAKRLRRAP